MREELPINFICPECGCDILKAYGTIPVAVEVTGILDINGTLSIDYLSPTIGPRDDPWDDFRIDTIMCNGCDFELPTHPDTLHTDLCELEMVKE
jgi:hypothetical protein